MFEKVCEILTEQLDADSASITLDTNIVKDLDADSLDLMEVVTAMEDEFHVMIPQDDLVNIQTVGQLVELLEKLQK